MDDQNNLNNPSQNPTNPLDQNLSDQSSQSTKETPAINMTNIQENENQDVDIPSFTQMDSSTPPPPPIPIVEKIPNEEQGTNAPNLDISPVVSDNNKPKKKLGGKTIATILGILILVLGIGAGVFLLNQQQEIRTKAGACCNASGQPEGGLNGEYNYGTCESPYVCTNTGTSLCRGGYECKLGGNPTNPPGPTNPPAPTNTPLPPTPTGTPSIGAQCLDIKAYDTTWKLLTISDLANLSEGDKVRFTVIGNATSGAFDKAKFTINSSVQPETTAKKPNSEEFYVEYTIPAGITAFTIDAQVHHLTQGWI